MRYFTLDTLGVWYTPGCVTWSIDWASYTYIRAFELETETMLLRTPRRLRFEGTWYTFPSNIMISRSQSPPRPTQQTAGQTTAINMVHYVHLEPGRKDDKETKGNLYRVGPSTSPVSSASTVQKKKKRRRPRSRHFSLQLSISSENRRGLEPSEHTGTSKPRRHHDNQVTRVPRQAPRPIPSHHHSNQHSDLR